MRRIDANRWNHLLGRDKSATLVYSVARGEWRFEIVTERGLIAIHTAEGQWEVVEA